MKRLAPVFLTGATGFVGRHLLAELGKLGDCEVIALVRGGERRSRNTASGRDLTVRPRFSTVSGDLRSPASYADALPEGSVVIHLAARTGSGRPEEYFSVNLQGTRSLLQAAAEAGVRRFVHVSTVAVTFTDLRHYPYARSKRAAEEAVKKSPVPFTIVRPTVVAGRGGGAWEGLLRLAGLPVIPVLGDGEAEMQPVAVEDLVWGLVRAGRAGAAAGRTLSLGGPEALSVRELLGRMHRHLRGGPARVLRLSPGMVNAAAALLEHIAAERAPVTRGQLRSFLEDGTVETSSLFQNGERELTGIDEMIRTST